jgi:LAO/AO transport system kinase
MLVCEAAGFDTIIIETVGVGQSEIAVADMVDMFLLLLAPGGGDELQGIKRGIVEIADTIVVTKRDGEFFNAASAMAADYRAALTLLRPPTAGWSVPVLTCSAAKNQGMEAIWSTVLKHRQTIEGSGAFGARREDQAEAWLWNEVREGLIERFRGHADVAALLDKTEAEVKAGRLAPTAAARRLLDSFAK